MKKLTKENLLTPDELSLEFINDGGADGGVLPEDFVERVLAARLSDDVPEKLHPFFDAARGAMIYGYFYYPLFTLATQNLLHFCEAAITLRYTEANGPRRVVAGQRGNTITGKIWWLKAHGFMKVPQAEYFQEVWDTRNWVFHRTEQRSFPPMIAMAALEASAENVSALFANTEACRARAKAKIGEKGTTFIKPERKQAKAAG